MWQVESECIDRIVRDSGPFNKLPGNLVLIHPSINFTSPGLIAKFKLKGLRCGSMPNWVMLLCFLLAPIAQAAEDAPPAEPPASREPVKLPGLVIDVEHHRVDVDAKVTLRHGLLELVACTTDTKEHESIVMVQAVPMHIHAGLLMLGAKNGNPAMVKPANEEKTRWIHLPPRGDKVKVSLVIKDEKGKPVARPIADFIRRSRENPDSANDAGEQKDDEKKKESPFDIFIFAGSQVRVDDEGNKRYLADEQGHVVSLSTFGDEVLCLPSRYSNENTALIWEVDPTHLPKVGTKVTLRFTLVKPESVKAEQGDQPAAPDRQGKSENEQK